MQVVKPKIKEQSLRNLGTLYQIQKREKKTVYNKNGEDNFSEE